jgi:4'-phosphopantetheinyl transferase
MIHVLLCPLPVGEETERIDQLAASLCMSAVPRLARFQRREDAQAHLLGRMLVRMGLSLFGYDPGRVNQLAYSAYQRPFIPGIRLDFNISHAGHWVACAVSGETRVGLDIERREKIGLDEYGPALPPGEWREVRAAPDPERAFFTRWTRREALIKANGKGWSLPPQHIRMIEDGAYVEDRFWRLLPLDMPDPYEGCLAVDPTDTGGISITFLSTPEVR